MLRWRSRCRAGNDGDHGVLWRWRSKAEDDDDHIISLILIACDVYASYLALIDGSIIRLSLTKLSRYK